MAEPKIRFDIEANATGAEDVDRLATNLQKLDGSIDPALAENARALAERLRELGQQQAAIDRFVALKSSSLATADALGRAQAEAQAFAREISQAGEPTRAQSGRLEKLRDAVRAAKAAHEDAQRALQAQRKEMGAAGLDTEQLAVQTRALGEATREAVGKAQALEQAYQQQAAAAKTAADRQAAIAQSIAASNDRAVEAARRAAAAREASAARAVVAERQQQAAAESAALAEKLRTESLIARSREIAASYPRLAAASADSAARQAAAANTVRGGLEGIATQLRTLQQLAGAAIGGQLLGGLAGQVAETADQYNNLAARIRLATDEGAGFDQAFEGVFDVATRTNTSLEATGNLFAKISQAGKTLNISQRESLALTETINEAVQVSGGSAQASEAAIQQLIQALESGVLRGDEFNSVMEQAPRLAKAMADGLGLTTGELRKQAEQGALTADIVIRALQGQAAVISAEFEQLPPTVGRALQNLSTEWTRYVGEVDKANGISAAAAGAINALARNLDTLAAVLYSAGKAAVAYQALKLAQTFLGIGSAARAAAVEVTAAAAATTAAGAAGTAAAAGVGRFAAILGGLKSFALIGILTNLQEIGTWIGEGIAKLQGYGKAIEELEAREKAEAEAARQAAAEKAAYAQQLQLATERSLGLTEVSKALVAQFDEAIKKGEGTAAALDKIGKALQLGDLQGIADAGAALDSLALKGKITGEQVSEAMAAALNGKDLAIFEAQARAAFDSSEQGARRLAEALDAVTTEALRRAGSSAQELGTGFSAAATRAINDLDALVAALEKVGASSTDAAKLLATSLNQAVQAASTEAAINAVIERYKQLGAQGLITGQQLTQGLEAARQKLDDLQPGINSLTEALATFGLKSRAELQATADKMRSSWEQIRNDTTVSLQDKIRAFEQYSAAAKAANGGVQSSELDLQRAILENQAAAAGLGTTFESAMARAGSAIDSARKKVEDLKVQTEVAGIAVRQLDWTTNPNAGVDANGFAKNGTTGDTVNAAGFTMAGIMSILKGYGLSDAQAQRIAREFTDSNGNVPFSNNPGVARYGGGTISEALRRAAEKALGGSSINGGGSSAGGELGSGSGSGNSGVNVGTGTGQRGATSSRASSAPSSGASTNHIVTVNLVGIGTRTVSTASASDSAALVDVLQQLEQAAARASSA